MVAAIFGYVGAIIASIFFGSNYVPVKKYPTGDGFAYVYIFSGGVMVVGLIAMFINGEAIFVPSGLLGGSLWALGNLCVIPIIQTIGLGLGALIWSGTSLITGFLAGKFGLFGLTIQKVHYEWANWTGIVFIIASLVVFFFIKPHLEKEDDDSERSRLIKKDSINDAEQGGYIEKLDGASTPSEDQQNEQQSKKLIDSLPKQFRVMLGFGLAIFSGILYGVNMVPMKLWVQSQDKTPGTLAFVFSHFTGIYLFSTVVFFTYCIVKRPPQIFPQTILPSFISGAMWGVAQCGLMVATQILGFAVGFPIGSAGPSIVNALWSVLVFREIRGKRDIGLLLVSFILSGIGIGFLSKSS